jgi:hypothetical protein
VHLKFSHLVLVVVGGTPTTAAALAGVLTSQRKLYITHLYQLDSQHYRKSVRRWSQTQAAAKKAEKLEVSTFVILHSSFVL